jgi:replicative DNA helicase
MIFAAMLELFFESQPTDLVTVSDLLKAKGQLGDVGGASYLASLRENTFTTASIKTHAELIKRDARKRVLIQIHRDALAAAFEPGGDPIMEAGETASRLLALQDGHTPGFLHVHDLVAGAMKQIEKAAETKSAIGKIPTGLNQFEHCCGSVRRGQLVVVGGRTSTGKTSFGLTVARHAAAQGCGAAFVSAESPLDEVTLRLLSQVTQIENIKLQNGILKDQELTLLVNRAGRLSDLPIWALGGVRNWDSIKGYVRGLKARQPALSLVLIDYAQLLDVRTDERRRDLEVSKISKESKSLAIELNLAVFLLSQLNRDLEKQERKPRLSDLKESGSLEQDADTVFLLSHDRDQQGRVDLDVAKMRDGRANVLIPMRFNGNTVSFSDWADE